MISKILSLSIEVKKLLICQWLISIGYFIVIPYLVIYIHKLGYSISFASSQLSILFVGQYVASLIGGKLTDKIGADTTTKIGLTLQIISCLSFLLPLDGKLHFCFSSLLLGMSKGLFTPASKALLSQIDDKADKILLYSMRYTINNIGVVIGSWIGGYYLYSGSALFFLNAGIIQFIALLGLFFLKNHHVDAEFPSGNKTNERFKIQGIIKNKTLILIAILGFCYNFIYIQLESAFPIVVFKQWGEPMVASIFMINSIVVILFQIPINNRLIEIQNKWNGIIIGFVFFLLSMLCVSLFEGIGTIIICIVFFSIGEIIIEPTLDALTSERSNKQNLGIIFGILGAVGLLGGIMGNTLAGYILGENSPAVLWTVCAAISAIAALSLIVSKDFRFESKINK